MTIETRAFHNFEVRTADDGTRTLEGIAVPWDEIYDLGEYRERFERGAFADGDGVGQPLYVEHGHARGDLPIGVITRAEDTDAGRQITARISKTPRGDEAYALLKDKAITGLSIGFEPLEDRAEDDGLIVRTSARTREVSITGTPAYLGALVGATRSTTSTPTTKEPSMPTTTADDLAEVRSQLDDAVRRLTVVEANPGGASTPPPLPVNSLGEFVRGLATGQTRNAATDLADAYRTAAEIQTRAYTGETTTTANSNVVPTWVDRDIKLVDKGRKVLNLFSKQPLPDEGMSISYPKFGSASGDVAEQAAQGDDLAYLKFDVTSADAAVKTYGGYSSLSRQVIERSSVAYLNKVLDYQKISYGKVTNSAVRSLLTTGATGTITGKDISAAAGDAKSWISAAIDAVAKVNDQSAGLDAEFWLMGLAHFEALTSVVDTTGRPVFSHRGDGVNTIGTVSVTGLSANVEGLPVVVDPTITGVNSYICSADAITVMESAGAPFNLADENIINLTKDFSLYGYMALTLNDAKGIVKVKTSAA